MLVRVTEELRPAKRFATYQDVIEAPEHMVAEILDGDLFLSPRPAFRHSRAASRLTGILMPAFDEGLTGPGGWTILVEPELHIAADVLVPDLAGWKRGRSPDVAQEAFSSIAPDWACEVLSPSTEGIDRNRKLHIYAREGVDYVWLIDPKHRLLQVHRRHGNGYLTSTYDVDEVIRVEPFEAIDFHLSRLWDDAIVRNGEAHE